MDASGTQVGERVEEAGAHVHLPEQVSDPDAWHEHVDRAVEAFAGGRRHGVVRRDAQPAVLEAHPFEAPARQLCTHLGQAPVQPVAPVREPGPAVGLQAAFGEHRLGFVRRRKVGVEAAVVPAAFDPYIAGAKAVAQCRYHGRLVGAPVGFAVLQDHRAPLPIRKRHRHDVRELASAGAVELAQQQHRRLQALARGGGVELEGFQKRGRKPAQLCVTAGRQRQRILRCQVAQRGDFVTRGEHPVPSDRLVDYVERVAVLLAGTHHGVDGAAEQANQTPDLCLAGRPRLVPRPAGTREQLRREALKQGDRGIGQGRVQLR